MNEDLNLLKEVKKLEVLLSQSKVALTGGSFITTIVVILFWSRSDQTVLISWLIFYYAMSLLRYYFTRSSRLHEISAGKVRTIIITYTFLTFLCGLSWGGVSIYLVKDELLVYSVTVILLSEGMIASGAAIYAIYPVVFGFFAYPTLMPLGIFLILQTDELLRLHGWLALFFLFFMSISSFRFNKHLVTSIDYQFENIRLLDELKEQQQRASELNIELESDLKQLKRTEEQLREEKTKAEDLANKLYTLSSIDGLTGIANRRQFEAFLAKEWNRARRLQTELSLILCDIDYFKLYNDYFGHQEGDKCLQKIAGILEEHARRGGDLAARYGGEEFVMILPDTMLDSAKTIAEQIRTTVEKLSILHPASKISNVVTVSIGAASIVPDQHTSSSALIAEADRNLYKAKANGRNQVYA